MKNLLIIGHTFPEPATTAAGSRMMQLIGLFKEANYQITFASTATISERTINLQRENISVKSILLNDPSFDEFIKALNPEIVIFDRYISEEQFGWRVSEICPNALKILDTEDLHFLRKAREEAVRKNLTIEQAHLFSDTAKREIASILRCDLSLIISEFEMELLQGPFRISSEILYYLPFLVENTTQTIPTFENRQDFLAIGNLLHAPNVDAILQLKNLWPEIKKQLPTAEIHIYGAYAPQQITQLHNENEGFLIKGWKADLEKTLGRYRLQLACIRFGAGLKGKLVDAMSFGLPSITTAIGAEGLCGESSFGGEITSSNEDFVKAAVRLYSEKESWNKAQQNGFENIRNRFQKHLFSEDFKKRIKWLSENLENHRHQNFIGQVLQHQTLQATKYMGKWIEAKNTLPHNSSPVCFANSDEVREEYRQ